VLLHSDLVTRMGATDPAFRERALADIRGEADRMARMVSELLILARADAGARVAMEPVPMREIVLAASRHGRSMAGSVRFIPDDAAVIDGAVVLGSADYLEQLLLILLDNAFKYTPPPGEVRIKAALEEHEVRVTVADTGSGIDREDLPHIFDRFRRGANVDGVTGTGLGLAIARWVAEQHRGRLDVDSAPGQGSRFTLTLPLTARADAQIPSGR
jgi:two-component system OmpR family sensor kinase